MEQLQALKARFEQLEQREQLLLTVAAMVIGIFIFVTLIYRPLSGSLDSARNAYHSENELRDWMQVKVAQLKQSSGTSSTASKRGNRSASVVINQAASQNSIQISRSQPRSNNQYQIWLEDVPFNQLMVWLADLQTDYGIHVHAINISRAEDNGKVRVNLTFQDGV